MKTDGLSREEKELLREATKEVLVACHPLPRPGSAILRLVSREVAFEVSIAEQFAALELLRQMGLVTMDHSEVGSTQWWTATPKAVLEVERGEFLKQNSRED
jgi:hypothetical protein